MADGASHRAASAPGHKLCYVSHGGQVPWVASHEQRLDTFAHPSWPAVDCIVPQTDDVGVGVVLEQQHTLGSRCE